MWNPTDRHFLRQPLQLEVFTFLVLEPGAGPDPKPSSGKQMCIQSGQWYFTSRNSKQGCHPGVLIQCPFLSDVWVWVRPPSQTRQAKEDIHGMCSCVPWFFQGSECDFRRKTTERRGKIQNCFSSLFQARLRLPKEQLEQLKWVGLCKGQSLLWLQTLEHWGLCLEMYRTEIIFLYSTLYAMPVKDTFPGHCSLLTTKSQTCLKYYFQPSLAWSISPVLRRLKQQDPDFEATAGKSVSNKSESLNGEMNVNSRHCVISRLQLQKYFYLLHMECRASQLDRVTSGFSIHLYEVTCLRTGRVACPLPVRCRKSHARMPSDSGLLSGHLAFHTHWNVLSRQRHIPAFPSLQNPSSSAYIDSFARCWPWSCWRELHCFPLSSCGSSASRKESQTLENNFREILLLTEQIDVLKALLRDMKDGIHNHSWPAHQEAVQNQGTTEVLDEVRLSGAWMRGGGGVCVWDI